MTFLTFVEGIFKAEAIKDCVQSDALVEKVARWSLYIHRLSLPIWLKILDNLKYVIYCMS